MSDAELVASALAIAFLNYGAKERTGVVVESSCSERPNEANRATASRVSTQDAPATFLPEVCVEHHALCGLDKVLPEVLHDGWGFSAAGHFIVQYKD